MTLSSRKVVSYHTLTLQYVYLFEPLLNCSLMAIIASPKQDSEGQEGRVSGGLDWFLSGLLYYLCIILRFYNTTVRLFNFAGVLLRWWS